MSGLDERKKNADNADASLCAVCFAHRICASSLAFLSERTGSVAVASAPANAREADAGDTRRGTEQATGLRLRRYMRFSHPGHSPLHQIHGKTKAINRIFQRHRSFSPSKHTAEKSCLKNIRESSRSPSKRPGRGDRVSSYYL